ncbi:MAG: biotin transporter BioY [Candidatus Omnitrophica bacterium]|nr:biotin transporter BioY [Candidatus Omnitrophota bacterium]MDD5311070.1 biotin transporter BioY [Candidatus Omnitrophota bacterium]MDD5546505.1 biotin transporter BioY [Candidatus Omnitrophota bacterium]
MSAITLGERYAKTRYEIFKWRYHLAEAEKLTLAFLMVGLMAVLAQVRIPLPWTPVPITGSTFAALFAGVLLGNVWGGISMLLYIALGAAGLPVFTGFKGGAAVLLGPTAGYLLGYAVVSFSIGYIMDNYAKARKFLPLFNIMLVSSAVILAFGSAYLAIWLGAVKGQGASLSEVLWMGFIPFIPGDIFKSLIAALIATSIMPKENYK